ncbi:Splicing factor U2af large subunit B [Linum perenne]
MSDHGDGGGGRLERNGADFEKDEISAGGALDNHGDSKSQRDYERDSVRSRDRDRERVRDKGRDRDRATDRDRDSGKEREKGRDMDRHHRGRDRNRDRDGNERRERGRDRDEDDTRRGRDYNRRRDNDRDREDMPRIRSKSPSRGRSRYRSKSRSRSRSSSGSRSKSKRVSGFDMAPPASAMAAAVAAVNAATTGQIPGSTPAIPGMFPNLFQSPNGQFGSLPIMPIQAMTQQATRHARRVYVGGLPPSANEQTVATYFSQVMAAIGGNTAGPGDAVVNVYINHEKKFAFVEMRSVEEASNAMAVDGIIFEGAPVKVRRPSDYNPSLAAALGPSQPSSNLNLAAVGLSPGSSGALEGPDRVFVGGLPYYFTEPQIRELLESFGSLRDVACAALNGIKMGDKTLTVRRANQNGTQPRPEQESVLLHAQQQIAIQRFMLQPPTTKVVCLTQVVTVDELKDDDEYEEIMEDMRTEGSKFGTLVNVVVPRPQMDGSVSSGVGKVFLEYADTDGSTNARAGMNGRKFGGNEVVAVFYPENKYYGAEYDG